MRVQHEIMKFIATDLETVSTVSGHYTGHGKKVALLQEAGDGAGRTPAARTAVLAPGNSTELLLLAVNGQRRGVVRTEG